MSGDVTCALQAHPGGDVPVIFIACTGRSGSTLLDRVIGAHDGFFSAGELHCIWERSFLENQLCGCGASFGSCDFWGEVSYGMFGVEPSLVNPTTAIELRRALGEIRYAPRLIASQGSASHRAALAAYSELLERLYRQILQVSRERVIIDSSGSAAHGLILAQVPGIELHIVHLVRDSRAVAFSWKRVRRRPEIHWKAEDMPTERVRKSASRWMMHNTTAELLSGRAASYCRVRYEDFVADPGGEMARILAPFEWAGEGASKLAGAEITLEPAHTVSGNPMRFKQGPMTIRLDDEWREAMHPRDRWSATALTWPLLVRYGYVSAGV
jgi:hypothetical protein